MSKTNKNFAWLLRYSFDPAAGWVNVAIFSTPKKAKKFAQSESGSELIWDTYEHHSGGWIFAYAARDGERLWQVRGYQFDA